MSSTTHRSARARSRRATLALTFFLLIRAASPEARAEEPAPFTQWESPHVHPLELVAERHLLVAVNTVDARLEVFDVSAATPVHRFDVPVGLDPVSVRDAGGGRVWVVNRVSDDISVVDLDARAVVATLRTDDEPSDVVFAGEPRRAFVTCTLPAGLLAFDPAHLERAPERIALDGASPRALAVSNDGRRVYAAFFHSGNGSTVLAGGSLFNINFPPNVVDHKASPYSGRNPPPNARDGHGAPAFEPPIDPKLPAPPRVGLIVKRDDAGRWLDDFGADWTQLVSGPNAAFSGRVPGWELVDHDVAVLDTSTRALSYTGSLMNVCMALAVHPRTGEVFLAGTDATNERRFEPVLRGRFLRVELARLDASGTRLYVRDLNPHLDPTQVRVARELRRHSVGDPRAFAWDERGERGFVAGMGSGNVVVVDALGRRSSAHAPLDVGGGPTGLAFDARSERLYVLCRFDARVRAIDTRSMTLAGEAAFFDPTPAIVDAGRRVLYDTHARSGGGQIACASCHVDARYDHLAWDLGDPSGAIVALDARNLAANNPALTESKIPGRGPFQPFHPMKGPMLTQSLQDIVDKEPFHWRGDRRGLDDFRSAFPLLQGADGPPSNAELDLLRAFLATIAYPPNPYRELDNSLPEKLALPGHTTTGRFGPAGMPLPDGDPRRGLERFRTGKLDNLAVDCVTCHTLPSGYGPDATLEGGLYRPIPAGARGEHHAMLVSQDGSSNVTMKVPQLRNLYERVGFELSRAKSRFGFGFIHDGSVDTLARFVNESSFTPASDQDTADLVAFLLAFSGSDLPTGAPERVNEPPGLPSKDTHAAVGRQWTFDAPMQIAPGSELARVLALVDHGRVGVVVRGTRERARKSWLYAGSGRFESDVAGETCALAELASAASREHAFTWTVVPAPNARRFALDRDGDGARDGDELAAGTDPADAQSFPDTVRRR